MSHYLLELYTPKPAWRALDPEDRAAFFDGIAAGFEPLGQLGIEVLGLGECDPQLLHASHHLFFGLWRAPDEAALKALVDGIAASGWHDYFETVNAGGRGVDLAEHLKQLERSAETAI